ncbi:hypothetical protein BGZ83_007605 [Gryganskiella cystojenkinii]|nr:hypothetical protein BGZ83_007605 [Gryganskiella cystojenkinii]
MTSDPVAPSTPITTEIPVLISGAGPTGLYAALLLTKMNIPCRVVERDLEFSSLSKCLWVHSRTLEILQLTDPELLQQFIDQGDETRPHRFYYGGKLRGEIELAPKTESHFAKMVHLPQYKTVRILAAALEKLGVKIDWGWELVDTQVKEEEPSPDRSPTSSSSSSSNSTSNSTSWVETKIRRAIQGNNTRAGESKILGSVDWDGDEKDKQYEYETVKSQFLIGADGGRSAVRHKINMAFPGRTRDLGMMVFDGTVETDSVSTTNVNWIRGTSGRSMAIIPLGGNRIQIAAENGHLTQAEIVAQRNKTPTVEEFQEFLDKTLRPLKIKILTVNWLTYYHVNERRAQEFSYKGRIFLAGDAAHIHSPAAGQGLNLGLQDVHNLAWKIAFVVQGNARISLLETYSQERAPVADKVIKLTADALDEDFNLNAKWIIRRILVSFGSIVKPIIAIKAAPVTMMQYRYFENSINKKHKTLQTASGSGAIGRRAADSSLVPIQSNHHNHDISRTAVLSEIDNSVVLETVTRTEQTIRLHELMTQVGAFQVLVFMGDLWARQPESAQQLAKVLDRHLSNWRCRWTLSNKENQSEKMARHLMAVHTLTTVVATPENPLADRNLGDGKAYMDLKGLLHRRYEIDAAVKKGSEFGGAIVIVRPDSHIAYRTQGVGERAWNEVNEYFESILVHNK